MKIEKIRVLPRQDDDVSDEARALLCRLEMRGAAVRLVRGTYRWSGKPAVKVFVFRAQNLLPGDRELLARYGDEPSSAAARCSCG